MGWREARGQFFSVFCSCEVRSMLSGISSLPHKLVCMLGLVEGRKGEVKLGKVPREPSQNGLHMLE